MSHTHIRLTKYECVYIYKFLVHVDDSVEVLTYGILSIKVNFLHTYIEDKN